MAIPEGKRAAGRRSGTAAAGAAARMGSPRMLTPPWDPHAAAAVSPWSLAATLRAHRRLLGSLVRREVIGRYRGSFFGLLWSFFYPVLMLAVYSVVFGVIFRARWSEGATSSHAEFALVLFAGLMMFNFFAECLNRAPTLVLSNANYVKKVVFPLELLAVVTVGSAGFHLLVSLGVWLIFYVAVMGLPAWTLLQLPLAVLPLALVVLGACWFLAALGVFLRDVAQVVGVAVSVLMFLSPIFYPLTSLPAGLRWLVELSPLTFSVEQSRRVMMWGQPLQWQPWLVHTLCAAVAAWAGYVFFQRLRRGFADVL